VSQVTGQRPRYIANVTSRARDLEATALAALEGGADALMVNVLAVGLDALAALVESTPGTPVFAHTAGVETFTGATRSGYGHALLIGRLVRLVGADAVLLSTPFASRPLPERAFRATVDAMRQPWREMRAAMPVVGGGLTAATVPAIVDAVGIDVIIGVGGAIQGHPEGSAEGARVVRVAIDDAVAGRRLASPERSGVR
jgi:2,3-diketo-5-methylthiopentyl-1-phosphate enolase